MFSLARLLNESRGKRPHNRRICITWDGDNLKIKRSWCSGSVKTWVTAYDNDKDLKNCINKMITGYLKEIGHSNEH